MAERSTITQVVNLGLESVPGTQVRANRRLQSIDFTTTPQFKVDGFRPSGFKYETVSATEKEWVDVGLKGQPTYTEILYMLAGVMGVPAAPTTILNGASADTGGRKWIFESNTSTPDTPQTYTFEQGSSVRAHSAPSLTISDFGLNFTRDKAEMSGKAIAQALSDGVTMTAPRTVTDATTNATATVTSPTIAALAIDVGQPVSGTQIPANTFVGVRNSATSIGLSSSATANVPVSATGSTAGTATLTIGQNPSTVPLVPMAASHFSVFLDSTSGALGTTKLGRLFSGQYDIANRFGPVWVVDQSLASWAAVVETVPTQNFKIIVEADAVGMGLLPHIRVNDTMFLRILATGPSIYNAGAPYTAPNDLRYTYQQDMAVQVRKADPFNDQTGVFAIGFDLTAVHDATWGKASHIEVVNKMTAM